MVLYMSCYECLWKALTVKDKLWCAALAFMGGRSESQEKQTLHEELRKRSLMHQDMFGILTLLDSHAPN